MAFDIGYKAFVNDGECIFVQNKEAMALIDGYKVGDGTNIIQAFLNGVNHARFESNFLENMGEA